MKFSQVFKVTAIITGILGFIGGIASGAVFKEVGILENSFNSGLMISVWVYTIILVLVWVAVHAIIYNQECNNELLSRLLDANEPKKPKADFLCPPKPPTDVAENDRCDFVDEIELSPEQMNNMPEFLNIARSLNSSAEILKEFTKRFPEETPANHKIISELEKAIEIDRLYGSNPKRAIELLNKYIMVLK